MPDFSTDLPLTKVVMLFFNPAGARAATDDGAMTTVFSFTTAVRVYLLKWSPWMSVTNTTSGGVAIVDPKRFTDDLFVEVDTSKTGADHVIIPPNSFALAATVEWIEVPRDVLAICVGKSTYARCGLVVNVTPLEPEWRGKVTLEISNTTPLPAKVYANEGIAQMIFLRANQVCRTSYADRQGKYQDQEGLTLPKMLD